MEYKNIKRESDLLYKAILLPILLGLIHLSASFVGIEGGAVLSLLNYIFMMTASYLLLSYVLKNHLTPNYVQMFFFVWLLYLLVTAIPNIISPVNGFRNVKLFMTEYCFLYSIPFLMIASLDLNFLKKLIKLSFYLIFVYLISTIFMTGVKNEGLTIWIEGIIILLMTWPYHSPKKRLFIYVAVIIVIVIMLLDARRNKVLFYGGGFLLSLLVNIFSKNNYNKTVRYSMIICAIIIGVGLLINISSFALFFNRVDTGMDSREGVILMFTNDLNSSPIDWITGRGIYGQFDGGNLNTDKVEGLRDLIENGYLMLILKGGLIWISLLALISINAIYKGLFKSKNIVCKGFAMIILLYYLDMIGYGLPTNTLKYMMIFISIAGCNTAWLRECTDAELSPRLGLK